MQKLIAALVAVAVLGLIIWLFLIYGGKSAPLPASPPPPSQPIASVQYQCSGGKAIAADYYQGESQPAASSNQPPMPGGSVKLSLSDGRSMTLPQTVSASGIRYANEGESVIFWSKGNGAFIMENNQQTYSGCIKVVPNPGNLPQVYEDSTEGFSIRYPADWTVDTGYRYSALGPGKEIGGIKFTVASSTAAGTNLAPDTYLSVEEIPLTSSPAAAECNASLFLAGGPRMTVSTTTEDGTEYSLATSSDAAVGNRYDETVYALPGTNPCIAVRYFVHYGVLANYPPGKVQQYDDQALQAQFDAMRRTLVVQQ